MECPDLPDSDLWGRGFECIKCDTPFILSSNYWHAHCPKCKSINDESDRRFESYEKWTSIWFWSNLATIMCGFTYVWFHVKFTPVLYPVAIPLLAISLKFTVISFLVMLFKSHSYIRYVDKNKLTS